LIYARQQKPNCATPIFIGEECKLSGRSRPAIFGKNPVSLMMEKAGNGPKNRKGP
jgi:hypothetical protein